MTMSAHALILDEICEFAHAPGHDRMKDEMRSQTAAGCSSGAK